MQWSRLDALLTFDTAGLDGWFGANFTWWPADSRPNVRLDGAWTPAVVLVERESVSRGEVRRRLGVQPDLARASAMLSVQARL